MAITSLYLVLIAGLVAGQDIRLNPTISHMKEGVSDRFGSDIFINNLPTEDQRNLHLAAAAEGVFYAIYTTEHAYHVMFSDDHGATWTETCSISYPALIMDAADIVSCGSDWFTRNVFIALVSHDPSSGSYYLRIDLFNAGGNFSETVHGESSDWPIYDVALASDWLYPALGASPYSLGVLLAKNQTSHDSLVFFSSGDGGETFGNRQEVTTTIRYLNHISLDYVRSNTYVNGRYYAAWDEFDHSYDKLGHILISHSQPYFDSPWTSAYLVDTIPPNSLNRCRRPTIACQGNDADNSLGNASAIVLFERDLTETTTLCDIVGVYNREAANTDGWHGLSLAVTVSTNNMPDATFDPYGNRFLVTYFDSTQQTLLYCRQSQDLLQPSTGWFYASYQYNDAGNLTEPWPRVEVDPSRDEGIFGWIHDRTDGRGAALFDSESNGVGDEQPATKEDHLLVYPVPASVTLWVSEYNPPADIEMISVTGKTVFRVNSSVFTTRIDLSDTPSGIYVLRVISCNKTQAIRFSVVK